MRLGGEDIFSKCEVWLEKLGLNRKGISHHTCSMSRAMPSRPQRVNHNQVPAKGGQSFLRRRSSMTCDNLKLMFDCYHTQIMQGDLSIRLQEHLGYIGHVQIAAVPDRGEPGVGELDFFGLMQTLDGLGYAGFVGAEYKPRTTTDAGLGWLKPLLA